MAANKKRNLTIDLLKFIFVLMIVLYHSRRLVVNDECTPMFVGGVFVVEFFFLTSGYFFARSATRKPYIDGESPGVDTGRFMLHKISGFLPNYYVAWVIAFAVKHIYSAPVSGSTLLDLANGIWELLFLEMTGIGNGAYIVNSVTWYISAMLIVMLALYPLLRKHKDTFFYVIAPLIVMFAFGILYQDFRNLKKPYYFINGLIMKGTIRAFAEIALGCMIFKVSEGLKKIRFREGARWLLTITEILIWTGSVCYMYGHPRDMSLKMEYLLIAVFSVGLLITTSGVSKLADWNWGGRFGQKAVAWLGAFSFSLYLGHGYWCQVFNGLSIAQGLSYWEKLPRYVAISLCTGLVIMYVSKLLRFFWKKNGNAVKSLFIHDPEAA